ncbi:MAG TPA: hypothetical protein VHN37_11785 [Actinomycetota bacterium]|nr:hypothetical protein [Actinomycetota bacterium]
MDERGSSRRAFLTRAAPAGLAVGFLAATTRTAAAAPVPKLEPYARLDSPNVFTQPQTINAGSAAGDRLVLGPDTALYRSAVDTLATDDVFEVRAPANAPTLLRAGRQGPGAFDALVELRAQKTMNSSGTELGRGAVRLRDTIANRTMELGFYEYGAGLFANSMFEFMVNGNVSLRDLDTGLGGRLEVRGGVGGDAEASLYARGGLQRVIGTENQGGFSLGVGPQDNPTVVGRVTPAGLQARELRTLGSASELGEASAGGYLVLAKAAEEQASVAADRLRVYVRDGTTPGTLRLVVKAGSAGPETTLLDDIPQ